jgi:DNA repair ATPase RecN
MIEPLSLIASESLRELSKLITGKLLTETQIQSVSKHIVGKYFTDWLPTPQKEAEAEERISAAKTHIAEATKIIVNLQDDLEKQANQLELLAKEIDEKKQVAERYAVLAKTNQDAFAAFKAEMEETVRKELTAQNEQGKALRRTVSFASWFITLVIGAALGALFQIYLEPTVKPPASQPASTQPAPDGAAPK